MRYSRFGYILFLLGNSVAEDLGWTGEARVQSALDALLGIVYTIGIGMYVYIHIYIYIHTIYITYVLCVYIYIYTHAYTHY